MKNTFRSILGLCLAMVCVFCAAALPPQYLQVDKFQKCLAQESKGSYSAWCMPSKRMKACPKASWKQLGELKGRDAVPPCAAKRPG